MAHKIILEHDGILRVRYSGQVGIGERRIMAERVLGSPAYAEVNRFLLDYRHATHLPASRETSRATARYLAERVADRDARVAWLVTYDHQLGYEVERFAAEFGVVTRRFRDYDEAVEWLQEAGAGAPRRAHVLATEACEAFPEMSPARFAALARLVQELLDEGLGEDKVRTLAVRMLEVVHGVQRPRLERFSTRRG